MPKTSRVTNSKTRVRSKPVAVETKASPAGAGEDLSQLPASFENKAGRYELVRIEDGQACYTFTNRQNKTVDATMPIVTWRKMQERAGAALKESA